MKMSATFIDIFSNLYSKKWFIHNCKDLSGKKKSTQNYNKCKKIRQVALKVLKITLSKKFCCQGILRITYYYQNAIYKSVKV